MGMVPTTVCSNTRNGKWDIMQVTRREEKRNREQEREGESKRKIRKCLVVVVVLITTLKIGRTRSRLFRLIFDTENVSSWSVSILLTSSVVE